MVHLLQRIGLISNWCPWLLAVVVAAGLVVTLAEAQGDRGRLYNNALYGYTVQIPAGFHLSRGAAGELDLSTPDNSVTVEITTISERRPGFPGNDAFNEGHAGSKDCDTLPAAYSVRKPQIVAFSCVKNNVIRYSIIRYTATGSVSLDAKYPAVERAHWDPPIAKMATSLKRTR